jgi:hypothetical protein
MVLQEGIGLIAVEGARPEIDNMLIVCQIIPQGTWE